MKVFLVGQLISFTLIATLIGLAGIAGVLEQMGLPIWFVIGAACGIIGTAIAIKVLDE